MEGEVGTYTVGTYTTPALVVGEPSEYDLDLQRRRIISALAASNGAFAMLAIPARYAGTLLAQFGRAGYRYRLGWSPSAELRALTIWRASADDPVTKLSDAVSVVQEQVQVEEAGAEEAVADAAQ